MESEDESFSEGSFFDDCEDGSDEEVIAKVGTFEEKTPPKLNKHLQQLTEKLGI